MNKPHTDIQRDGRFMSLVPEGIRRYLILMRADRPVGTLLLLWPCFWSIFMASGGINNVDLSIALVLIYFALGAFLMRSAGCIINDLWDRNLDSKVERTALRPIASGEIKKSQALMLLLALLLSSFIILLQLGLVTILLGVLSLALVILYPLAKRFTYWPQIVLGCVFNFGALMGWSAIEGYVSLTALVLYVSGILWTLGYDTIYAYQDIKDDAIIGIKSTALKFKDQGRKWVFGFYAAHSGLFLLAGFLHNAPAFFYIGSICVFLFYTKRLVGWNINDPIDCLQKFKGNITYGFALTLMIMLF